MTTTFSRIIRKSTLWLTTGLTLFATACGGSETMTKQTLHSSLARQTEVSLSDPDRDRLAAMGAEVAISLYRASAEEKALENYVMSPYSVTAAFAMLYAGAKGQTAAEIAEALAYSELGNDMHRLLNATDLELETRGEGAKGKDGADFELVTANSRFVQSGISGWSQEWLDTLALNYGAGAHEVDFNGNSKAAADTINEWASQSTRGKINEVVMPQLIKSWVLALANATYFNAAWQHPFDAKQTQDEPFMLTEGSEVSVPMMHVEENFGYSKGEGYQAVSLPYDDADLSFVAILPEQDLPSLRAQLSAEKLREILSGINIRKVDLFMPSFSIQTEINLKKILMSLGVKQAFSDEADLSGIHPELPLTVSDATQKAIIDVNESGTEAAAVTVIGAGVTSVDPNAPVRVRFDRPFLYCIVDKPTGQVLFMGHLADPSAE